MTGVVRLKTNAAVMLFLLNDLRQILHQFRRRLRLQNITQVNLSPSSIILRKLTHRPAERLPSLVDVSQRFFERRRGTWCLRESSMVRSHRTALGLLVVLGITSSGRVHHRIVGSRQNRRMLLLLLLSVSIHHRGRLRRRGVVLVEIRGGRSGGRSGSQVEA